jgi:AcrR family transcriptional regulator
VKGLSPRKSAQDELTKTAIINEARELFVASGYPSFSMRKLAKELGCSHGAIYYHFKNKAELFYEIVTQDFLTLDGVLEEVLGTQTNSNEEKLYLILFEYIRFGLTNQPQYEVMFLIKDEEIKSYLLEVPNKSYLHFANAVASLVAKPLSPKDIWSLFIGIHGFVTHYCRTEISFEDVKQLAKSHVEFLLKAIK